MNPPTPPSTTPFADSHFADLVKERDQLKSTLAQREVQLKKALERIEYCENRMAEKNVELESLEQKLSEANKSHGKTLLLCEAELSALRKDKERLDWLELQPRQLLPFSDIATVRIRRGQSLRTAIDTAIQGTK